MYHRHELLRALGALHGQMLNYSAVARTLATTRLQVDRFMRRLRGDGYLRLLPSLPCPCPPDMIRRPRLYLRARAWREVFAATPSPGACQRVPLQGQLASRITDGIIERETDGHKGSRFFSMGRYRRRGVDLVVVRASGWRVGFSFEPWPLGRQAERAVAALRQALDSGWINAAVLVSCEGSPALGRANLLYLPAPLLLAMYRLWTSNAATRETLYELLRWLDEQVEMVLGGFSDPEQPLSLDFQYDALPEEDPLQFLLRPP